MKHIHGMTIEQNRKYMRREAINNIVEYCLILLVVTSVSIAIETISKFIF